MVHSGEEIIIAERFNRLSIGCTSVTHRQTTDRQTDIGDSIDPNVT